MDTFFDKLTDTDKLWIVLWIVHNWENVVWQKHHEYDREKEKYKQIWLQEQVHIKTKPDNSKVNN